MRVGRGELQIIEESPAWTYPRSWPRLSKVLDHVIALPKNLKTHAAKRKAVEDLQASLKHIEVVSAVLRFLCPEEFGIISLPVVSLLNLAPGDNYVDYYLRYIGVLKGFVGRYEPLDRVADIDMALWSAAVFSFYYHYHPAITDEMHRDDYFQEVRLSNLVEGLGRHWQAIERQRLLFARVFVKQDYLAAAPIAARACETVIREIAGQLAIEPWPRKRGQSEVGALAEKLDRHPKAAHLTAESFQALWSWRNDSVHSRRQIKKDHAERFVSEV